MRAPGCQALAPVACWQRDAGVCVASNCSGINQAVCRWQQWRQGKVLRCPVCLTFIYPSRSAEHPDFGSNNIHSYVQGFTRWSTFKLERLAQQIQLLLDHMRVSNTLGLLLEVRLLQIFCQCLELPLMIKVRKHGHQICPVLGQKQLQELKKKRNPSDEMFQALRLFAICWGNRGRFMTLVLSDDPSLFGFSSSSFA